jgi:hypothetical protein
MTTKPLSPFFSVNRFLLALSPWSANAITITEQPLTIVTHIAVPERGGKNLTSPHLHSYTPPHRFGRRRCRRRNASGAKVIASSETCASRWTREWSEAAGKDSPSVFGSTSPAPRDRPRWSFTRLDSCILRVIGDSEEFGCLGLFLSPLMGINRERPLSVLTSVLLWWMLQFLGVSAIISSKLVG